MAICSIGSPSGRGPLRSSRRPSHQCTKALIANSGSCPPPKYQSLQVRVDACTYQQRIFATGAKTIATAIYQATSGGCAPSSDPYDFYDATEVLAGDFAALTAKTE